MHQQNWFARKKIHKNTKAPRRVCSYKKNRSTPKGLHCKSTPRGVCIATITLLMKTKAPRRVCIYKNAEAPRRVCNCKNTPQGVCITEEHLPVQRPLTGVPSGWFKHAPTIAIWRQILKIRRSRLRSGWSRRQGRSVKLAHRLHSVAVSRCYHFPFFAGFIKSTYITNLLNLAVYSIAFAAKHLVFKKLQGT